MKKIQLFFIKMLQSICALITSIGFLGSVLIIGFTFYEAWIYTDHVTVKIPESDSLFILWALIIFSALLLLGSIGFFHFQKISGDIRSLIKSPSLKLV